MTEEEAKTKWCPMARAVNVEGAVNRSYDSGEPDPDCLCLGSGCAVWMKMYDQSGIDLGGRCGLTTLTPRRS